MFKFRSIPSLALLLSLILSSACFAGPPEDLVVFSVSPWDEMLPYGYADATGKVVIPPQFRIAHPFSSNGLARVDTLHETGFIDAQGKWAIEPEKFDMLQDFDEEGFALAHIIVGKKEMFGGAIKNPVYQAGFINSKGQWIIKPNFKDAGSFASNGLARATDLKTGLAGYIGRDGQWRIPPSFRYAGDFAKNGLAFATEKKDKTTHITDLMVGYINETGEFIISPRKWSASTFSSSGIAKVVVEDKIGYIDTKGDWVWEPMFTDFSYDFGPDGTATATLDHKYKQPFLIDKNGKKTPLPGSVSTSFSEQGFAVMWGGEGKKTGLIDGKGEWVLPPEFGSIGDGQSPPLFAPNGWLMVMQDGKYRLVNRKGGFSAVFDAYISNRKAQSAAKEATRSTPKAVAAQKAAHNGYIQKTQNYWIGVLFGVFAFVAIGFGLVIFLIVWLWKKRSSNSDRPS